MTSSKTALLAAERTIEISQLPLPEIGDADGLLRVEACGVCGADIPPYLTGHSSSGASLPLVLGHEVVGRISSLGEIAARLWGVTEGDRVVIEEHVPCGHCELCFAGLHRMCTRLNLRYGNLSLDTSPGLWGGYSEFTYLHPNAVVHSAPEDTSVEELALFVPIANGLSWVQNKGGAQVGSTILIQGPGQHGLGCVVGAREAGAQNIIVVGLSKDNRRLEIARELGATHTIIADQEDILSSVQDITDGKMADLILELTPGAATPVEIAPQLAAIGGTIVLAGSKQRRPISNFQIDDIMRRELIVKGVWGRESASVKAALKLIESGKYPLHLLCTHQFDIEHVGQALEVAANGDKAEAVHVTITPHSGANK